jgi:hypothetical protein
MGMFMEATQATAIVLNAVWFAVCCAVDCANQVRVIRRRESMSLDKIGFGWADPAARRST